MTNKPKPKPVYGEATLHFRGRPIQRVTDFTSSEFGVALPDWLFDPKSVTEFEGVLDPPTTNYRKCWRTLHHEAGHAVMAHYFRWEVAYIKVFSEGDAITEMTQYFVKPSDELYMIACAGVASEVIHGHCTERFALEYVCDERRGDAKLLEGVSPAGRHAFLSRAIKLLDTPVHLTLMTRIATRLEDHDIAHKELKSLLAIPSDFDIPICFKSYGFTVTEVPEVTVVPTAAGTNADTVKIPPDNGSNDP